MPLFQFWNRGFSIRTIFYAIHTKRDKLVVKYGIFLINLINLLLRCKMKKRLFVVLSIVLVSLSLYTFLMKVPLNLITIQESWQ